MKQDEPNAATSKPLEARVQAAPSSMGGAMWPQSRRGPHQGSIATKKLFCDGPYGEEVRMFLESVSLLRGWRISDTIQYYVRLGKQFEESSK